MNWFTNKHMGTATSCQKEEEVKQWGGCEHVEKDSSLLHIVVYENDSFGREGYCQCRECHEVSLKHQGEEEVVCYDCNELFEKRDTIEWKPYDFYAPQGDEPLIICENCASKEKHKNREAKDKRDYEYEMNSYRIYKF